MFPNLILIFEYYIFLQISNLILKMVKDKIIDVLEKAGKPLRPGEIAEIAGLDKKDVDNAIKKLKTEEKIYSPKRCFYDIKK